VTVHVLVDTSVWIEHFRKGNATLVALLAQDAVLMHPLVLAELACGTPPAPREHALAALARLRVAKLASHAEIMGFIESETLYGQGCGALDVSLLASARITSGARLWTIDQRLAVLAERLGIGWSYAGA
jgi:predicted nucleic acid-binding protein